MRTTRVPFDAAASAVLPGVNDSGIDAEPSIRPAFPTGRKYQSRGAAVAVVGDGVNHAPVLAQADVSIAMGDGAHLAQLQGDAVLTSGRLQDLAWAARHVRKAPGITRQNIAWAFAYNVAVPLSVALEFLTGVVYWRALKGGQFDDLEWPGLRVVADDDRVHNEKRE